MLVLCPNFAIAGAWLPKAGSTQIIANSYVTTKSDAPLNGDLEIYAEHGVSNNTAFVLQATVSDFYSGNLGGNIVGSIRIPVRTIRNWQSSLQFGVIGAKSDRFRDFDSGVEARLSLGRSFENGIWVDGEFGLRNFRNINLSFWEAAIGKRLDNNDMVILKGFGDNYLTSVFKTKTQLSYVHNFNSEWAFELGWRLDFKSYHDAPAQGVVIGIWHQF
ncbi:MAG: hypothetical protein FD163_958 [Hyphomonadaceae bacterium]|nr:MAG: hypothetical protein FD163_958 [Hyphomonadaceae bacterium]